MSPAAARHPLLLGAVSVVYANSFRGDFQFDDCNITQADLGTEPVLALCLRRGH